ncbi:hypothetical protein ACRQ1B_24775 [Rhizobium panacihumi]|uniref:hypothetical protein n=1 Tax=Rhizobium panacihumi TaxID=2008450 RepID=UPI003D7B9C51
MALTTFMAFPFLISASRTDTWKNSNRLPAVFLCEFLSVPVGKRRIRLNAVSRALLRLKQAKV